MGQTQRDKSRSSFVLQMIPLLLSNAETLPQGCKDRKEMGICRGTSVLSHPTDTPVLERHLLAPTCPLHLQLLEAPSWEHHCLGHREEAGGTNRPSWREKYIEVRPEWQVAGIGAAVPPVPVRTGFWAWVATGQETKGRDGKPLQHLPSHHATES